MVKRALELETREEHERGYARERRLDETRPQRVRPRLGGTSPLPADGAASELFLVQLEDLTAEERAGAGWCVRIGVPDAIPSNQDYDVHELLVEFTVTMGGATHTLEVNAFPGGTVHLVGEQLAGKLKWARPSVVVPPGELLRWQVSRGLCRTTASRAFDVQAATTGRVPLFATGFALFSADADLTDAIALDFATHGGATRVIQHYTTDDLLQAVGQYAVLPPGAGEWRWLQASTDPARLVFCFGEP